MPPEPISETGPDEERVVVMRLQKYLARAGAASRRGAENLMTAGRVAVNGVIVTELGSKVDPAVDVVTVDGAPVNLDAGPVYLVLNKPPGYVTTMDDPQGRPTVRELIPSTPGLFPVGRLDRDTIGLLLFTTDGELSHQLLHPRYHVSKTYRATVDGIPTEESLDRLRRGITLDDGPCRPAIVSLLKTGTTTAVVEISISEGRKRQVKRMLSAISHPVLLLERTSFGPLFLGTQEMGTTRELGQAEVDALRRSIDAAGESRSRDGSKPVGGKS
ncbi:MAG: pseudouridine synthase [Actinomycetota bacterium]|nr:pseudouridine synthase [Actinomycetota bacterium]